MTFQERPQQGPATPEGFAPVAWEKPATQLTAEDMRTFARLSGGTFRHDSAAFHDGYVVSVNEKTWLTIWPRDGRFNVFIDGKQHDATTAHFLFEVDRVAVVEAEEKPGRINAHVFSPGLVVSYLGDKSLIRDEALAQTAERARAGLKPQA